MPDLEISNLPAMTGAGLAAADPLAIADISASETKKVTAKDLVQASMQLIDDDSIPGGKIAPDSITADEIADNAIGSGELADGAVDTAALQDDAVTQAKMADASVGTNELIDSSVTTSKLGAVTDRGLDQTTGSIGHSNSVTSGTFAGITYDAQGHVTAVPANGEVPPSALPEATSTVVGAVKPGTGLNVQGDGTLDHSNSITAGSIGGLSFDAEGHLTAFPAGTPPVFERDAIPIAGDDATELGGVWVPNDGDVGISVNATTGELKHETSGVVAGTYASTTVDANGHVTAGQAQISTAQLPNEIPADQIGISNGKLPRLDNTPDVGIAPQGYTVAIENSSISRRHLSNTSIAYIQEDQPTANASPTDATVFRGCFWLRESTGQLYMYNGNAWRIVAGGRITKENLRFCGTIDASTGLITSLTDEGVAEQLPGGAAAFQVGFPLPNAEDEISAAYFMVTTAGSNIGVTDVIGEAFGSQDLVLAISAATGWVRVAAAGGGGGGGGTGLWTRTGAAPDAQLTPDNAADNVVLSASDWLTLPRNTAAAAPGGGEGSLRWHEVDDALEVYTGTAWARIETVLSAQWETISAADNADWGQPVLRPAVTTTDIATALDRDVVFSRGTTGDADDTGDRTSNLTTAAGLTAARTWTLPDESGTFVTRTSTVAAAADTLVIDANGGNALNYGA